MKRYASIIGSVVAVAATATVLLATVAQGNNERDALGGPGASSGPASGQSVVGALRSPSGVRPVLPAPVASELEDAPQAGVDIDQSRVASVQGGWRAYLTPASEAVCLSIADPAGGGSAQCIPEDHIASGITKPAAVILGCEGGSETAAAVCDDALFFGVVRDGVGRVEARLKDGSTVGAAVENNVYFLRTPLSESPVTVTVGDVTHDVGFVSTFSAK